MSSHIIDSALWSAGFASERVRATFNDQACLARWLEVEGALAAAQGELGMIPRDAAERIVESARLDGLDLEGLRRDREATGHSLIPLLRALARRCGSPAGDYVHFGATTQDIQDTAQALAMREVTSVVEERLLALIEALCGQVRRDGGVVMVGRTHNVPALPITFGLKLASWIDELLRAAERLRDAGRRAHVVQLFGGAGTSAAFAPHGLSLVERVAARLGLGVPSVAWHNQRDRIVELVSAFVVLGGALARMANELLLLSRPEVGEVRIAPRDVLSSSTMPHKHNPEECEQVVALWRLLKPSVLACLDSMDVSHERDFRGVRLEWAVLPPASHYIVASLELCLDVVGRLEIDREAVARNLARYGAEICSERLMFRFSPHLGKEPAYALVARLYRQAAAEGRPLSSLDDDIRTDTQGLVAPEDWRALLDPTSYTGHCDEMVDRVLARAREVLACGA